jgi:hypothetical protein
MKSKPRIGKLIQVLSSGKTVNLVENKPFAALQEARKRYIQRGYDPDTLKLTYLKKY